MKKMKVKVRDVQPNPHRDFKRNPLSLERVEKFKDSIKDNGFWENIIGRKTADGIQLAYGHHRLEALLLLHGEAYEFDLRIMPLDDIQMYHVMIAENDDYGVNMSDTIDEAVAEAKKILESDLDLAKEYGQIKTSNLSGKVTLKVGGDLLAHFMQQRKKGESLNPKSTWGVSKIERSLARMEAVESGKLSHEAIRELPSETHAAEFARAVNKKGVDLTPKEQVKIAKKITESGDGKRDVASTVANESYDKKFPKKEKKKIDKKEQGITQVRHHISDSNERISAAHKDLKALLQIVDEADLSGDERLATVMSIYLGRLERMRESINLILNL